MVITNAETNNFLQYSVGGNWVNIASPIIGRGEAGVDYTLTFDGQDTDGVITWMEDEDYFQFGDDILMSSTERIYFLDTALSIYSSTDGQLDIDADTE